MRYLTTRLVIVPACALAFSAVAVTAAATAGTGASAVLRDASATASATVRSDAAMPGAAPATGLPSETTAPSTVEVRVEGADQTLFEGPVETEGGYIEASSDTQPRECDGTNGAVNPTPGATETKAAVDAMQIIGQTFDGEWDASFGDYFISRFGPDSQNTTSNYYWGSLDNDVFLQNGGCQTEVSTGDQVLWQYNAFSDLPFLKLEPVGDSMSAAPPLTVDVVRGRTLALQVDSYTGNAGQSYTPVSGAEVAPVTTAASTGYQTVDTTSRLAVTTNGSGVADLRFLALGWHRLKAAGQNDTPTGTYLRSNRLDVCVERTAAAGCGQLPADDQARCVASVACTPVVSGVFPAGGSTSGGNTVFITGTNFVSGATVDFGTVASSKVTYVSDTRLRATAPSEGTGAVDITVTTAGGTSATSTSDHYTYRG